jgi:hypothetical protein
MASLVVGLLVLGDDSGCAVVHCSELDVSVEGGQERGRAGVEDHPQMVPSLMQRLRSLDDHLPAWAQGEPNLGSRIVTVGLAALLITTPAILAGQAFLGIGLVVILAAGETFSEYRQRRRKEQPAKRPERADF